MLDFLRASLLVAGIGMTPMVSAEASPSLPSPGEHAIRVTSTWDGTRQPALLFVPTASESETMLPLLVALHGKGVDHTAWFRFTPVMEKAEAHGFVVATPHGRGDFWYRGPGEQDVLDLIDHLLATRRIDPDRVYLAGHSMGGWGTWWIGLRNADRFASIAPMAGLPPMDLLPNALHLDPYIIHDRDDDIVPVDLSRCPAARLSELGISHRYVETTGYRHGSRLIGDSLDDLFDWFSARRRVSDPKRIMLAARTPAKAGNGSFSIIEMDSTFSTAEVELEGLGSKAFTIRTRNVKTLAFDFDQSPSMLLPSFGIQIDGQEIGDITPAELFYTANAYDASKLILHKADGSWVTSFPGEIPPPAISAESVSAELESQLVNASQEDVARAPGPLVARAAGADAMIVRADAFAWLGSPLTPDRLAESYVSGAESLGHFALSGRQIGEVLLAEENLVLAGIDASKLDEATIYSVVSPMSPLVRHETLKRPLRTTTPVYPLLLEGLGIRSWE